MSTANEAPTYRFGDFCLDVANRQLWHGPARVDLAGRYFDALVLLVREHGQLVAKDRFFEEVWGDVVVSDAALTQCIKDVRKQLGDTAVNPRFIQTVPRYGYRFIGPVTVGVPQDQRVEWPRAVNVRDRHAAPDDAPRAGAVAPASGPAEASGPLHRLLVHGIAGALGGGLAGVPGGVLYGLGLASTATEPSLGVASLVLVLVGLCVLVGGLGGGGVAVGMAAAGLMRRLPGGWSIAGAAVGGGLVGGLAKLLGVDAFTLLFGRAPAGITGGPEGAVLGAALALGAYGGGGLDASRWWRPVAGAGLAGAGAGVLIPLAGGHLMGGSLELLARSFTQSRLQLDGLGRLFGEVHFGATTQVVLGGVEGLLFGSGVVGALVLARRVWPDAPGGAVAARPGPAAAPRAQA